MVIERCLPSATYVETPLAADLLRWSNEEDGRSRGAIDLSAAAVPRPRATFGFRFCAPLALGATLNPVNSTMIATAIVPIAAAIHVTAAQAGWLIGGLYVATSVAQPTMGRLADLFGGRRVFLASLVMVALAGLIGHFAHGLPELILSRVLLGIGTSGAYPSAMRMFRVQADRTGSEPPRKAMGVLSLAALGSAAIGPLLGGVLTTAFGWQAIFTVNVPLAIVTAILVLIWTPKDPPATSSYATLTRDLDLAGIAMFAAFLLSLMAFLMNLARPIWWTGAMTVGFGALFAWHSLRRSSPFIDVRMLARNVPLVVTYARAGTLATIVYCIMFGYAQWLESAAHYSSSAAGLVMIPLSIVAAVSSFAGARTKGIRAPFLISIGSALAGCVLLLCVGSASPVILIVVALACFGLPQGMFATATQAAIYLQAPPNEIGMAAGLQRTAQYIGAIVATSILGFIYGTHATDDRFHMLAIVMTVLSCMLLGAAIVDRTIPRGPVGSA